MNAAALRWGFVFLSCPLALDEDQKLSLAKLAAKAWFEDATELTLTEGEFRATVRPTSDTVMLGTFYGQRFSAEVFLPERSGKVEFLVAETALAAARREIAEA